MILKKVYILRGEGAVKANLEKVYILPCPAPEAMFLVYNVLLLQK